MKLQARGPALENRIPTNPWVKQMRVARADRWIVQRHRRPRHLFARTSISCLALMPRHDKQCELSLSKVGDSIGRDRTALIPTMDIVVLK